MAINFFKLNSETCSFIKAQETTEKILERALIVLRYCE